MSWTPERENKLKDLWKKGHTASQIAALIGETTRNAVIGKAHRLKLEARAVSRKDSTTTKIKAKNAPTIIISPWAKFISLSTPEYKKDLCPARSCSCSHSSVAQSRLIKFPI